MNLINRILTWLTTDKILIKYIDPLQSRLQVTKKGDWIDLYAAKAYTYKAGDFFLVALDIAMQLPKGKEGWILPRGSTFKNFGIIQTNHKGIVDNTYCGDTDYWFVPCYALRDGEIQVGDRTHQFRTAKKMKTPRFVEVNYLGNPDRGGHGSTGK
jgi:dUTP pyrophosphatase